MGIKGCPMTGSNRTPIPRFVFHAHKPKADMIADRLKTAATAAGYDLEITKKHYPKPGRIGLFYGVVPETYSAFCYYKAERSAIYLDNGWLSTPELPTFRFSWNGVQSFLQDMPPAPRQAVIRFGKLPELRRKPQPDLALLVLQSRLYFDNLRLGYSLETWTKATARFLEMKGYRVEIREKPTKKNTEAETFFDQMARAGIVVSLNSAATLKALRYGIPSYCMLDCTLSPYAPVRLPDRGKAGRPTKADVDTLCLKLASYEIDKVKLSSPQVFEQLLSPPPDKRRGYWYGKE